MKSIRKTTFRQTQFVRLHILLSLLACIFYPGLSVAEEWVYTTRPGDTLWDISQKHLKSVNYWSRLQKHNNIDAAKRLSPGSRLRIPLEWLKIQAAPATVVSVMGQVHYKTAENQNENTLIEKQNITIGYIVITGDDGSALIQFADSSTLLILKNTQVNFNTLSAYGQIGMIDTRLRLQQGRVETSVTPLRDTTSRYEITTPAAVAAVRGTKFRIAYNTQTTAMASEVTKGAVNVAAQGIDQSLNNGYGSITEQGKPPQAPVKLLEKPDLEKLPQLIRSLPFTFSWPSLNGAESYRIQLASAQQPDSVLLENTDIKTRSTVKNLPDGFYILRVRGIDKSSLEGFNAEHKFEINTNFPVAKLIAPAGEITLSEKPVPFTWSAENNVAQYHLQLAKDKDFSQLIIDELLTTNTYSSQQRLQEGIYYWRVITVDQLGNSGKASETTQFIVSENSYESLLLLLYLVPAFILYKYYLTR